MRCVRVILTKFGDAQNMYWIVFFYLFSGPNSDPLTDLFVPDFAKGKEFETRDQCQKFLTESFNNDEFGDIYHGDRQWQLVKEGQIIRGFYHSNEDNGGVISHRMECIDNPVRLRQK